MQNSMIPNVVCVDQGHSIDDDDDTNVPTANLPPENTASFINRANNPETLPGT